MNRKTFIEEITEKGNFNGDTLTLRLPDVLRIADKLFGKRKTKATAIENCSTYVGQEEIPTDEL